MKYKLIACDMDETLLNDEKDVSPQNHEAITKACQLGVKFVLASGRGFMNMQDVAKTLNLSNEPNEYTISFNGGVITENKDNNILLKQGLSFEQAQALFNLGLGYNVGFHIYTLDTVYIYRISDEERDYMTGRLNNCINFTEPSIDFLAEQSIMKIIFQNDDRHYLEMIERAIPSDLLSTFSITYSGNRYIEFNRHGVSKGDALIKLANQLNIKPAEILSIGDNNNDISMIKAAGLGIAVANAAPDAKAAANVVSDYDNNQSAIAHIIEQYILE